MDVWIITAGCHHCETEQVEAVLDYEPSEEQVDTYYEAARRRCSSAGVGVEKYAVQSRAST